MTFGQILTLCADEPEARELAAPSGLLRLSRKAKHTLGHLLATIETEMIFEKNVTVSKSYEDLSAHSLVLGKVNDRTGLLEQCYQVAKGRSLSS